MTVLFLSHAHEDADLAIALKDFIEDAFVNTVRVFASSDPRSLPLGVRWQDELWKHLEGSRAYVIVLSPVSLQKPWVTFEAGAASGRNVPLIPICVRGLGVEQVGAPINTYQMIELTSQAACTALVGRVSELHGSKFKVNSRLRRRVLDLARVNAEVLPIELAAGTEEGIWRPDLASVFGLYVVYLAVSAQDNDVTINLKDACDQLKLIKYDYAYGFLVALRTANLILFRSDFSTFWSFDYIHPVLRHRLRESIAERIDTVIRDEGIDDGDRSAFDGELRRIDDYLRRVGD